MSINLLTEILFENWHIILLFFTIAVLYSSVGFGGGSSYLAVLALSSLVFTEVRAIALLCNIVVVAGNVYLYHQQRAIKWKKIIPLIVISVPLAFIGGYLKISQQFFFILLGFTLFFAAISMWISKTTDIQKANQQKNKTFKNLLFGGSIGLLSGMVGIGGGIFLSPLLHLTNWDSAKNIAATSSFFILVNSVAGLSGQFYNYEININWNLTLILLVTVFIGGQIGNRLSNRFFSAIKLKKATAILIAFVSIRILLKYLL